MHGPLDVVVAVADARFECDAVAVTHWDARVAFGQRIARCVGVSQRVAPFFGIGQRVARRCRRLAVGQRLAVSQRVTIMDLRDSMSFELVFSGLGRTSSEVREARSGPLCPYCMTDLLREKCGSSREEEP